MVNIDTFDRLLDDEINQIVIEELYSNGLWTLAVDDTIDCEESDQGFNMCTYSLAPNVSVYPNEILNSIGKIILKKVVNKYENNPNECMPVRFLFNYYNRASSGQFHIDNPDPRSQSIIYYFNTCDGGSIVNDEFIKSESGKAVVFNSNIQHKGIGPTINKNRYVLNIVYLRGNI